MTWISTNLRRDRTTAVTLTEKRYTRFYDVLTDSIEDGPEFARTAPGIPPMLSSYSSSSETDPTMLVVSKEATTNDDNASLYHVQVDYSTLAEDDGGSGEEPTNPLLRDPIISFSPLESTQAAPFALDDNGDPDTTASGAILNSAGDPFDPLPQRTVYDALVTITRNEATFPIATFVEYQGVTNADTWSGFDPGTVLLQWSASSQEEQGIDFWRVVYELFIRVDSTVPAESWYLSLTDEGRYSVFANLRSPVLDSGTPPRPVVTPVLLNGSGMEQGLLSPQQPFVLRFQVNAKKAFAPLNLPTVS